MKLNKIFLLAGIALAGVFASCSDDDDYTKGPVASGNQLQTVTFGTDNMVSGESETKQKNYVKKSHHKKRNYHRGKF